MSLRLSYRLSGNVTAVAEGANVKEVMEALSDVAEVFACASECGCCGCKDIKPSVRHPQQFTYYELQCCNPQCGARLSFGQHQTGETLFAKRFDQNGHALVNGGWSVYQGNKESDGGGTRQNAQQQRGQGQQRQQATQQGRGDAYEGGGTTYGDSELPF